MQVAQNPKERETLLGALKVYKPEGETNTPEAFQLAYQSYPDVDTILLFTDGRPELRGRSPENMREQVLTLCKAHPNVPVNAVGLGDYFDKDLSGFLLEIARATNGAPGATKPSTPSTTESKGLCGSQRSWEKKR